MQHAEGGGLRCHRCRMLRTQRTMSYFNRFRFYFRGSFCSVFIDSRVVCDREAENNCPELLSEDHAPAHAPAASISALVPL